jgi:hypothetical protein
LVDEARLGRLLRETERMIAEHWPAVVAVGQALLEREVLMAAEVYRIILATR